MSRCQAIYQRKPESADRPIVQGPWEGRRGIFSNRPLAGVPLSFVPSLWTRFVCRSVLDVLDRASSRGQRRGLILFLQPFAKRVSTKGALLAQRVPGGLPRAREGAACPRRRVSRAGARLQGRCEDVPPVVLPGGLRGASATARPRAQGAQGASRIGRRHHACDLRCVRLEIGPCQDRRATCPFYLLRVAPPRRVNSKSPYPLLKTGDACDDAPRGGHLASGAPAQPERGARRGVAALAISSPKGRQPFSRGSPGDSRRRGANTPGRIRNPSSDPGRTSSSALSVDCVGPSVRRGSRGCVGVWGAGAPLVVWPGDASVSSPDGRFGVWCGRSGGVLGFVGSRRTCGRLEGVEDSVLEARKLPMIAGHCPDFCEFMFLGGWGPWRRSQNTALKKRMLAIIYYCGQEQRKSRGLSVRIKKRQSDIISDRSKPDKHAEIFW